MKKMFLLSILLAFSTLAFGENNYLDEESQCVVLSYDKNACTALQCVFQSGYNTTTAAPVNLCISPNRIKYCMNFSSDLQKCQRKGCFFNFERNLCYPRLMNMFTFSSGATFAGSRTITN